MDASGDLLTILKNELEPYGMEVYMFKVGWYNAQVSSGFRLAFADDTVCAVVLTIPSFFEKAFLPYLKSFNPKGFSADPIDSCTAFYIQNAVAKLKISASIMYDYEMLPSRRPKVLVQTAAHIAGAAFYYQRCHVTARPPTSTSDGMFGFENQCEMHHALLQNQELDDLPDKVKNKIKQENGIDCSATSESHRDLSCNNSVSDVINKPILKEMVGSNDDFDPWNKNDKIFGVCIHPKYGGWFAIRCVVVFDKILHLSLTPPAPEDCVPCRQCRIELLNRFNGNWKDWTYRDIIRVKERYSDKQKLYFETSPKDRKQLLGLLWVYGVVLQCNCCVNVIPATSCSTVWLILLCCCKYFACYRVLIIPRSILICISSCFALIFVSSQWLNTTVDCSQWSFAPTHLVFE